MANLFNEGILRELAAELEALKQKEYFVQARKEAEQRQITALEFSATAEESLAKAVADIYKFEVILNGESKSIVVPKYEEGAELITFDDKLNTEDMSKKRGNENVKDVSFTRVSDYPIKEYGLNGLCKVPSVLMPKFQVIKNLVEAIDNVNADIHSRAEEPHSKPSFISMTIKAKIVDDKLAVIPDGGESSVRKAAGEIIELDLQYGKVGSIANITIYVDFVKRNFHERMEYFEQIVLKFGIESMMQLSAIQLIDKL